MSASSSPVFTILRYYIVQFLDNGQQEVMLIELLKERGGVTLSRYILQQSENDDGAINYLNGAGVAYGKPCRAPVLCKAI